MKSLTLLCTKSRFGFSVNALAGLLAVCVFAVPLNASGQAPLDESGRQAAAEEAFFEGLRLYSQKAYPQAIEAFQAAYAKTNHLDMLFNVARCYEALGSLKNAATWYQAYLKEKPVDESAVLRRLSVMSPSSALGDAATNRQSQTNLALKPVELQPIGTRWLKWGLIGLSGTALSVGALATVRAIGDAGDVDAARDDIEREQRQKTADRSQVTALSLLGVGLVSGGVATYLILSEARELARPSVDVSITQGGAGVSYSTAF